MTKATLICPCLSSQPYQQCCQPLHKQIKQAKQAEQLMRSRYSAFVLKQVKYLIKTLHPSKRQADDEKSLVEVSENTDWLGLKIITSEETEKTAQVEFIAFYRDEGIQQLHERSNFIRQDNKWFYLDGELLAPIKLARNEPCFCGNGKKFKRCHAL